MENTMMAVVRMLKKVLTMTNTVCEITIMTSILSFLWKPRPYEVTKICRPMIMLTFPRMMPAIVIFVPPARSPVAAYGQTT
eukprot:3696322-Heterocapsa_arctica.AAC.1